jgi:hypothetical protein
MYTSRLLLGARAFIDMTHMRFVCIGRLLRPRCASESSHCAYLPRPKSLKRTITAHLKKPDLDKLTRAVKDALTLVVWQDDSQVVQMTARKAYAAAGAKEKFVLRVQKNTGHDVTLASLQEAITWFTTWLKP